MATDPSWLYSTIAQSSAAIVAIIGGFITASVLMLRSEKRSMEKQKSEKETRIKAIKKKRAELYNIYETNEAEWFLKEELTKYSDDNIPTLEKIFDNYPSDYRKFFNKEILLKEFLKLSFEQLRAKLFILKHADAIDINNYDSFLEWAKHQVPTKDYIEIVKEYDKYFKRQKKLESASNEVSKLPSWISPDIIQNQLNIDKKERELKQRSKQDSIYNNIEKLDDQISLLNSELDNLNSQLNTFSYPPNLGWGLAVLGYQTILCIFWPVLTIATEAFSTWSEKLIMYSFYFGILLIFAYIFFQIRTLRRK